MNDVVIGTQGDHQWCYCRGARGDDDDITAGTCSRDSIFTVIYNVSADVGSVNKTQKIRKIFTAIEVPDMIQSPLVLRPLTAMADVTGGTLAIAG